MKLILCRHGLQNTDTTQALSEEGKKDLKKTIIFLKKENLYPEYIYTSPATRATQTAELYSAAFRCPLETEEALRLFDSQRLVDIVKAFPLETLLFVGHGPTITEFAQSLVFEAVPEIGRGCALIFHVNKMKKCLTSMPLAYISPDGVIPL